MLKHIRIAACMAALGSGAAFGQDLTAEIEIDIDRLLGSGLGESPLVALLGDAAYNAAYRDLAPDARRDPEYGTVNVFSGATADPLRARIRAGGFFEMSCGGEKFWFNRAPDVDVNYQGDFGLRVLAVSKEPVAMLVVPSNYDFEKLRSSGCGLSQQGRGGYIAASDEFGRKGSYGVFIGSPREDHFPRLELLLTERTLDFFARPDWRESVVDAGGLKNSRSTPQRPAPSPTQPQPSPDSDGSKPFVIGMSDGPQKDTDSGAQSNPVVIGMAGTPNATPPPDTGAQSKPFVINMAGETPKEPENLLDPPISGTLCTNEDWVVFSAVSDMSGKVVSICMSEGDDTTPSHLTYRFGRPGDVELLYPSGAAGSKDAFMLRTYTRAQTSYLKFEFRNGGFDYAILEGYDGDMEDIALRVTRLSDNKVISLQSLTMQTEPLTLMQLDGFVPTGPFDE